MRLRWSLISTGCPIGHSRRSEPAALVSTTVRHPAAAAVRTPWATTAGVVALVEVDAAEEHAAPDGRRRRPTAPSPRGRAADGAGNPGSRRGRPRRRAPTASAAARPSRAEHDARRRGGRRRCARRATAAASAAGRTGSVTHRIRTIRGDAHDRVARRPRRPHRPDAAAPRARPSLEVARRRHDDRRHPPARRARCAGDRGRRRVRRRPRRAAGRARRSRRRRSCAPRPTRIAAARPTAVNLSWAVSGCCAAHRRRAPRRRCRSGGELGEEDVHDQPRAGRSGAPTCWRSWPTSADADPHPLQHRRAGVRRVGDRARHRARAARAGSPRLGDRRRDAAAAAGVAAHRLRAGCSSAIDHRIVVDGAGRR